MTNQLTRRALLASAPATGIAVTAPVVAAIHDPLVDMVQQWKDQYASLDGVEEYGAEEKALFDQLNALEGRIADTPAQTSGGALAKLEWVLEDGPDSFFACPSHRRAIASAVEYLRGLV